MKLEEIIKTYGNVDYYEMGTGRTFKLSEMTYNLYRNVTNVPVIEPNGAKGYVELSGNNLVNENGKE